MCVLPFYRCGFLGVRYLEATLYSRRELVRCPESRSVRFSEVINPRRACSARVTVLGLSVLPSVRLSGTPYSGTTRNKAAKKRCQRVQCHTGLIFKIAIFVKVLRSKVMA